MQEQIATQYYGVTVSGEATNWWLDCHACAGDQHYDHKPTDADIEAFAADHRQTCGRY